MENVTEFPHGLSKGQKFVESCIEFIGICNAGKHLDLRIYAKVLVL